MVTPEDLLLVARTLAAAEGEAAWRSSVSRAYYAAFHHCRAFLEEAVGLLEAGTGYDHRHVAEALFAVDAAAGAAIRALRVERNVADYSLAGGFSRSRTATAVATAARLLQLA